MVLTPHARCFFVAKSVIIDEGALREQGLNMLENQIFNITAKLMSVLMKQEELVACNLLH